MDSLADIRKEYQLQTLQENEVENDPVKQFAKWWGDAIESKIDEVNAMTLSTVNEKGKPSARIVLLKGFDENGFVFFTNYNSHKGDHLKHCPYASLIFFWKELERQVKIEGEVTKVSETESDIYFNSRPPESRIGAWASPQSKVIENRSILEENLLKYRQQFTDENIPRPPHWGGYIVKPTLVEFWQGRPSRLHDRILYTLQKNGAWKIERLAP